MYNEIFMYCLCIGVWVIYIFKYVCCLYLVWMIVCIFVVVNYVFVIIIIFVVFFIMDIIGYILENVVFF